jgi:hypothetical protein
MCPFLRGFRHNLQQFLTDFEEDEYTRRVLPLQAVRDLHVWAAAVADTQHSLPIPHRLTRPSLNAITFVSDAAGAQFIRQGDYFIPYCTDKYRGAASLSENESGIWFCARVAWPEHFLLHARDGKNHAYGCKSSTLEAVGVLLPFICCPAAIAGMEVVLHTDNEAVVHGWNSRKVKNDTTASILVRAIHILSFYLGCTVTVEHLPRNSTTLAKLADHLSRSSTTGETQEDAIKNASSLPIPGALLHWLQHPTEDWNLPYRLLDHVKNAIPCQ